MEHMKNVARGLENKIIELQQKLDARVSGVPPGGATVAHKPSARSLLPTHITRRRNYDQLCIL